MELIEFKLEDEEEKTDGDEATDGDEPTADAPAAA